MWKNPVCLLCLKTFESSVFPSPEVTSQTSLLGKFVLLSERHLNLPTSAVLRLKRLASRGSACIQFCSNCEYVVTASCREYQDLCAAQLKLDWRLKELGNVIEGSATNMSSKMSSLLHKKLAVQLGLDGGSKRINAIRRQISRRCRQVRERHKLMSVHLERISHSESPVTAKKPESFKYDLSYLEFQEDEDMLYPGKRARNVQVKVEPELAEVLPVDSDLLDNIFGPDEHYGPIMEECTDEEEPTTRTPKVKRETWSGSGNFTDLWTVCDPPRRAMGRPAKNPVLEEQRRLMQAAKAEAERPDEPFQCELCSNFSSHSKQKLSIHVHRTHEKSWRRKYNGQRRPYQCYFCSKSFGLEQTRQLHIDITNHTLYTTGRFMCYDGDCGNVEFEKIADLNEHFTKFHSSEEVYRCPLCTWPFVTEVMREVHELTHVEYERLNFPCPKAECNGVFKTCAALQSHYILEHTSLEVKLYKCNECGASYRNADGFRNHLKIHEMEKQVAMGLATPDDFLKCDQCTRFFPTVVQLSEHIGRMHEFAQCSKCGKSVPSRKLAGHMRQKHEEGKPFPEWPCGKCGKAFNSKQHLKRHMKQVHESVKTEQCHICDKRYQRRGLLNRHMRDAHQIEDMGAGAADKFICTECGKTYLYKMGLDAHMDAKHNQGGQREKDRFHCALCPKVFWRPSVLNKHLERAHGSELGGMMM